MTVKSVYNFVPAPKENEVFKPEWAKQVSHDIPFSDGESGEIEIKITAKTPIFIRNGHSKDNESNEFSHYVIDGEKKYFIPATSLKGMLRNVLEIITSSRMNLTDSISEKNPVTYGMRDMNNPEYTADNSSVKSGWLIKKGNDWVIQSCTNHKLALNDIETKFNLEPGQLKDSGVTKNKLYNSIIKEKKIFKFSFFKDLGRWVGKQYEFDEDGDFEGYIVLYGDIDNKRYDYIFSQPNDTQYSVDPRLVDVLDNIEKNREKPEDSLWLYFRKENWQPGIPVFFTLNEGKKTVKHFGLTKLYRRNNSHYLNNLEPLKSYLESSEKEKLDFAELLFGSVRTEALKGRVFISHAWSNNAMDMHQDERILNSPKPSFYPAYLKQEGTKGKLAEAYKTYHNDDAELRGFKRYPVHLSVKPNIESENENIASQFIPLREGAVFTGKIRYFNLRPCEIGALISAITFHGNSNMFFHSIGGVKPYGFGKVKIQIENYNDFSKYLKDFEFTMNRHLKVKEFVNQESIKELLSIASSPKDNAIDELLQYPLIEIQIKGKKENEFNNYKKDKKFLEDYSERNGIFRIYSKVDNEFLQELEEKRKKENQRLKEEEKEKFEEASNSNDINIIQQFIEDNPNSSFLDDAQNLIYKIKEELQLKEQERKILEEQKRREQKIEAARSGLPKEWNNINSFKNLSNRIPQWIKLQEEKRVPDHLVPELSDFLHGVIKFEMGSNKTKRDWKGTFEQNRNWKKISSWLGEALAKNLFKELTNPNN